MAIAEAVGGALKKKTFGITIYLSPEESAHAHALAADMGCSLYELLLIGMDRMHMQRGMPPVRLGLRPRTGRDGRSIGGQLGRGADS